MWLVLISQGYFVKHDSMTHPKLNHNALASTRSKMTLFIILKAFHITHSFLPTNFFCMSIKWQESLVVSVNFMITLRPVYWGEVHSIWMKERESLSHPQMKFAFLWLRLSVTDKARRQLDLIGLFITANTQILRADSSLVISVHTHIRSIIFSLAALVVWLYFSSFGSFFLSFIISLNESLLDQSVNRGSVCDK